jgi:hypothetical protein
MRNREEVQKNAKNVVLTEIERATKIQSMVHLGC